MNVCGVLFVGFVVYVSMYSVSAFLSSYVASASTSFFGFVFFRNYFMYIFGSLLRVL